MGAATDSLSKFLNRNVHKKYATGKRGRKQLKKIKDPFEILSEIKESAEKLGLGLRPVLSTLL